MEIIENVQHQMLFLRACIASRQENLEDMHTFLEIMDYRDMFRAALQTLTNLAAVNSGSHDEIKQRLRLVGARMEDGRLRPNPTWSGPGFSPQQQTNLDLAAALQNVNVNEDGRIDLGLEIKNRATIGCSLVFAASVLALDITQTPAYADMFDDLLNNLSKII